MSEILQLDYYYGIEAEQFSFYRVPRLLIKDERFKKLSSDAKLLYGLMLDRMSLSIKNEWFDEDNRAYIIYTIDSIMEDLGCGKEKAVKVLAELDSVKGIGLVEKVHRGLGKWKTEYAPKSMDEEWHPCFVEALQNISKVEYQLDTLLEKDIPDRASVVSDIGKGVKSIAGRIEEYRRSQGDAGEHRKGRSQENSR